MSVDTTTDERDALAPLAQMLGSLDSAQQMQRRSMQDMFSKASAETWERRAAALEWARPRPGDFTGSATAAELAERDRRLATEAEACRQHAAVLRGDRLV